MRRRLGATLGVAAVLLAACASANESSAPTTGPDTEVTDADPVTETTGAAASPAGDPTPPVTDTGPVPVVTDAPPALTPLTGDELTLTEFGRYEEPIAVVARESEPGTVYVAERAGRVRRVTLDGTIDDVVLDISDDTTTDAERGLLGVTFSSDGSLLYVSFTDEDGNSRIDEYGVVEDGTVDTESRRSVFDQDQPFANHNGGHVATGPDGFLYIGLGDGGAAGDPERSSLDPSTVLGKLLRIDPSRPSTDLPYSVPEDNPFVGVDGARAEIWSLGLRNPWRFSFDRTTGDLWIGDVGQNVWEEIDRSTVAEGAGRGVDFGWSAFEGTHRFNDDQSSESHTPPIFEYDHGEDGCSVTGGHVYRGTQIPGLVGTYVFGDYCSGLIWGLQQAADGSVTRTELARFSTLVSFGEDAAGELYAVSLDGEVARLSPRE